MFNMLNTQVGTGKNPPWMCKILVTLTVFFPLLAAGSPDAPLSA